MIAKYWRVRNKDAGAAQYVFQFQEIKLLDQSSTNIVSQATVSGTHTYALAIDGNVGTYWESNVMGYNVGTNRLGRQFIQFNFPAAVDISAVAITPQQDNSSRLLVEFSHDGNIWFTIARDELTTLSGPRTIAIPAAPLVLDTVAHPYYAIRIWTNCSPTNPVGYDVYMREVAMKDLAGEHLTPRTLYRLSSNAVSLVALTNLFDDNHNSLASVNIYAQNAVANYNFATHGSTSGALPAQSGVLWCNATVPQILNTIVFDPDEIDGLSYRPKNISISYCDNKEPYSSYQDIAHWHDIAMVDDLSLIAGNICTITGLATGNPRLLPAPPVITIDRSDGTYAAGTAVAVTLSSAGTAYYTLDGSTPTTASAVYSGTIILANSCTLKVIAYDSTGESASAISTVNYTVDAIAPNATFVKPTGTYPAGTAITVTADESATIYYSTDGTTPTTSYPSKSVGGGSTVTLFNMYASNNIKFIAKDSYGNISAVQTCYYRIQPTVTMNLPSGTYPECSVKLTMNATGNIYYTTDGTTPTNASNLYSASVGIPIFAGETKTIKAIAYDTSYSQYSDVVSADFIATVGARYWRFKVNTVYSGSLVEFKNLQFRETKGGSNIVTAAEGATIINAPAVVEGLPIGFDLFTEGTDFEAILALADATITVDFGIPRTIRELVIDVVDSPSNYWPYSSVMQASVDGIAWIDASNYGQLLPTNQYLAHGVSGRACVPVAVLGAPDTYSPLVAFSCQSGNYPPGLAVELFSTEGNSVYYTTDGSEPSFSSAVYSTPIILNASAEIKAITKDAAGNISPVASQAYNIKRAWTFWRYKVTSTGTFVLRNLEFYGSADSSVNIVVAGDALVAGSPTTAGADPSLDTFNSGSGYEATFTGPFHVDVYFLNAEQEVVDIKSLTGNTANSYGAVNHAVYASDDGETWRLVKTMTNRLNNLYDFGIYGLFYGRVLPVADTVSPTIAFNPVEGIITPTAGLAFSCNKRVRVRYVYNTSSDPTLDSYTKLSDVVSTKRIRAAAWDLNDNRSVTVDKVVIFKPVYRFWRLRFYTNCNGNYNNSAIYKLAMTDTIGGSNIVTEANGVTVSATDVVASMVNFTGTPTKTYTTNSSNGSCIQATFPTAVNIKEFTVDVSVETNPLLRPNRVILEASADGITWSYSENFYLKDSICYASNVITCTSFTCPPIIKPVKAPGKYVANTVFKFDTNQSGMCSIIYSLDGSTPMLDGSGNIVSPAKLYDIAAGISWGSGSRTLTMRAVNTVFSGYSPIYGEVQTLTYEEDCTPASIVFDTPNGEQTPGTVVSLTASEQATIYYTTDDTLPTTSSTVYTEPIDIGTGMRIQAIAVDTVGNVSPIYEGVFSVTSGTPAVMFSLQSGEYLINSVLEMAPTLPGTIYYTLDGSTPTTASAVYSDPIVLDSAKTVTAFTVADSNAAQSNTVVRNFTVDTILAHKYWRYRIFSTYYKGYSYSQFYGLELRESIGGANVFIAANVTDLYSSPAYSGSITLAGIANWSGNGVVRMRLLSTQNPSVTVVFSTPRKIKEIRLHQHTTDKNEWPDSFGLDFSDDGVNWTPTCRYSYFNYSTDWGSSAAVMVRPVLPAALPAEAITWQTQPGVISGSTYSVYVNKGVTDRLAYTTNGTEPVIVNGVVTNGSYTAGNVLSVGYGSSISFRIKAISLTGGVSEELIGTFTIDSSAPVISVDLQTGITKYHAPNTLVTVTTDEPADMWWTFDTTVTIDSTPYTGPIALPNSCRLNVLAKDAAGNSRVTGFNFYIDSNPPGVNITLPAGEYQKNTLLTATAEDISGPVVIRYTTDGTIPTAESSLYMAPGVPLVADCTFSVVAWDANNNMSAVVSTSYILDRTPPVISFVTAPGVYTAETLQVFFAADEIVNIYYTVDGSEPSVNSILCVDNHAVIHATSTIKAIGIDLCDNVSAVIDGLFKLKLHTNVKMASALAADMHSITVAAGQTLIASDQNSLFIADGAAHVDQVADFQASSYQPLANRRVWHDTAEGVTKYNNGVEWVPTKSPTTPKDFGEF